MKNYFFLLLICTSYCYADEFFDSSLETECLTNVQQLTFPTMGFEKAGEAYFSPDGKTIIFQAVLSGEEHYQIFTMDIEERIPCMVSTGKGACTCAYFRPDGKKIIFASSHEDPSLYEKQYEQSIPGYKREGGQYSWAFTPYMNIYEANLDGTELKALTSGPAYHAECAYSSDGNRIVYASNEDGTMNLYTMNNDGSCVQQITHSMGSYNGGSFFSPDGTKVVFRADYDQPHYLQIYIIDSDGSHLTQLTKNGAVNWAPYWHPSGDYIAYTTSLHGHANYEIYLMELAGGRQHRITHNPTFDGLSVFSNDGKKLMWTSKRGVDKTSQIFIADFNLPKSF